METVLDPSTASMASAETSKTPHPPKEEDQDIAAAANGDIRSMETEKPTETQITQTNETKEHKPQNFSLYTATTDHASEELLAQDIGYPAGWHVVRTIPHEADLTVTNNLDVMPSSYCDRIYTGVPGTGCDMYYNHNAAMSAALKWVDGKSTPFDERGGQMLERLPLYAVGDYVDVFYEDEDQWFTGKITDVKEYLNDIRYNVYYEVEGTKQDDISEDYMRPGAKPVKKSKKKKKKSTTKSASSPKKKSSDSYIDPEELENRRQAALEVGFPDTGWLVSYGKKGRLRIWNPEGQLFTSKQKALDSMKSKLLPSDSMEEVDPRNILDSTDDENDERSLSGRKRRRTASKENKKDKRRRHSGRNKQKNIKYNEKEFETQYEEPPPIPLLEQTIPMNLDDGEDGDPAWRRDGHELIGKLVEYTYGKSKTRRGKNKEQKLTGLITGWIDENDKDSNGDPGFVSEITGLPAKLFHIAFDQSRRSQILFVNLEEDEARDCVVSG